ncbi:TPA: DUF935 family protein [Citrobacter farmeri]|nr:DUF935 family protein [Citrobacter farmeri]
MVQILDQYGRPLNREVLKAPQSARTVQLNRDWPTHPSRGMTIARLPRILEAAERGDIAAQADLFEDMLERDGHIFSEMAKRKNALLTLDWSIEPPRNATAEEKKIADMVSAWFDDLLELEDITLNAAEAIGHGFSAQEIEKWERDSGTASPVYRHFTALSTTGDITDPAQDALDSATRPGESISQAMEKLIAPLVTALQQGQTPDDALDIVAASYPLLDDDQLQQLLHQAIFVSEVWGRLNAES